MKTELRGVVGLSLPFLLAFGCVAEPSLEDNDGGDGQPPAGSGGNAGSAGSGTSGTPAGGTPSGGASGTAGSIATGGSIGTGGIPTGGAGGFPPNGGVSAGGTAGATGGSTSGGTAGTPPTGGRGGTAGASGTAGKGGSSGTAGSAGTPGNCAPWPAASSSQSVAVSSTRQVSGTYDGMLQRFVGSGPLGTGGQQEGQAPLFELANGATLRNVILGSPAADGVYCQGSCTLENVWWEDVGEDAATFRGSSSSQTMTVRCSGAKAATDKIFQHNGAGTLTLQYFFAENFNKLYRSCGNCSSQYARHVVLQDVTARTGQTLVGVNTNYGDSADFERVTIYGRMTICERYTGNSTGAEPIQTGEGADSQYCRYESSDIIQR
jgi:pectate lyase